MPIWTHKDHASNLQLDDFVCADCPFCQVPLQQLHSDNSQIGSALFIEGAVFACVACGWWRVLQVQSWVEDTDQIYITSGAVGSIIELDLTDTTTPLEEVRAFLSARYEARFNLHPRLFEETVGSVFGDLGFDAEVTGYSNDGGIDVILRAPDGQRVGVQVKRYKDRIGVEQIRALTGALVLGGYTKGVFVTTSDFQAGAETTAGQAGSRGYPIELVNGTRFLEAIRIAQRDAYKSIEDLQLELTEIKLTTLKAVDGWGGTVT